MAKSSEHRFISKLLSYNLQIKLNCLMPFQFERLTKHRISAAAILLNCRLSRLKIIDAVLVLLSFESISPSDIHIVFSE